MVTGGEQMNGDFRGLKTDLSIASKKLGRDFTATGSVF